MQKLFKWIKEPFLVQGRADLRLVAVFVLIHVVLVVNLFRHSPEIQYDSSGHRKNIEAYAAGRMPDPRVSTEFFSAPLPYVLPALLRRTTGMELQAALRGGQVLNVALSLMLVLYLLRLAQGEHDPRGHARWAALLLLGMMPVYYRTFAMVRGEPLITAFALPAFYFALRLFGLGLGGYRAAIGLGALMGLMALSRQWGVFLLLAMGLFAGWCVVLYRARAALIIRHGLVSAAIGMALCGWFYLHLHLSHGSVTAFNQPPRESFSLTNRPAEFLTGTGEGLLFQRPFRDSYDLQFLPVFYSDLWGDYWGYFLIYGRDTRSGDLKHGFYLARQRAEYPGAPWMETNLDRLAPWLGRTNALALFPSALLVLGVLTAAGSAVRWLRGRDPGPEAALAVLASLGILASLAGYFWWLLMYRTLEGSSIKATYMLQIMPLAAVLAGHLVGRVDRRHPALARWTVRLLALCAVAFSPFWFSRFLP